MTRKTFADYADDSVRWTGIPQLLEAMGEGRQPRYHLRILPVITLGLASVGMVLLLADRQLYWLGYTLLMVGFSLGTILPLFGPIKPWSGARVDEWDRQVRHNAYFATFAAISAISIFGLVLLCWLTLSQAWSAPDSLRALTSSAVYLMTMWSSVPTLHASWATRPIDEEEDA